jgi:sugar phosphate isomerase/epimerase
VKLSLFSISYAGLWGQHGLSLADFIAKAANLGYQQVMLAGKRPHVSPLDFSGEAIHNVRRTLEQHGVGCGVVAGYTDFGQTAPAEVPYMEMQIAYVQELARVARTLGAGVVRIFTAYERPGDNASANWNRVVAVLQEVCDRAAALDVTIAVQNHHDLGVHTDALLELLSDIDRPNCRLGFDAWSPALRGEDLYRASLRAAPFTAITTNADYVRLPRFWYRPELVSYQAAEPPLVRAVPFGDGFIDFEAFFRGLEEGGFDGIATFEMCSPLRGGGSLANLDRCAAAYVSWMQEHGFASHASGQSAE